MARYDALSRAGEQADRMTAASLPYIREAAGANAVPSAMNAAGAMQDMVLRQAEHEVRLQDIQLRHQLLGQEIMLRQQLAPLQVAEAQAQLESMRIQQQIRDLQYNEAQYAAAQPRPAIGSPETGWKVWQGGRLQDASPDNPLHAYSIDLATRAREAQDLEMEGARSQIEFNQARASAVMLGKGGNEDLRDLGDNIQREAEKLRESLGDRYAAITTKKGETKPTLEQWTDSLVQSGDRTATRLRKLEDQFDKIVLPQDQGGEPEMSRAAQEVLVMAIRRSGVDPAAMSPQAQNALMANAAMYARVNGISLEAALVNLSRHPDFAEYVRLAAKGGK